MPSLITTTIQGIRSAPNAAENAIPSGLRTAQVIAEEAWASEGIAEAVGGAEVGGALIAGFSAGALLLIIACAIIVLLFLYVIQGVLLKIVGNIWFIGGPAKRVVQWFYQPIDYVFGNAISLANSLVGRLWKDTLHVWIIMVNAAIPHTSHNGTTVKSGEAKRLQNEIDALQFTVNTQAGEISNLERAVSHTPVTTGVDTVSIQEQIHHLQSQVHVLYDNQVKLFNDIERLGSGTHSALQEAQQLQHELHNVRQVQAGWDEIVQQIQDMLSKTEALDHQQSADIATNTDALAELSPLTLLLQPGMKGLRNLRKLEDDPCQCPKFAGIGGDIGTALAVMEFVENG